MSVTDPWLSVADVAEMLALNQQTVRNLIDRGELAAFHVGRRVRIRGSDLEEFLTRTPVEPAVAPIPDPKLQRSAEELVARERLSSASRAVAAASKRKTNDPLVTALLELSEAARTLAVELTG